jgi:ABC-type branched-subunit amino acid transport system ATPase component
MMPTFPRSSLSFRTAGFPQYGCVLETGRVALQGPYDTLLSDARVKRAYLGI